MPTLSKSSLEKLATCDKRLQKLFAEVAKTYDCTVICGHRNEADQTEAYRSGHSKVKYPNSKHNSSPSMAADVLPFPIDWNDKQRFFHFAGFVMGVANQMGIKLVWGGDFNGDLNFKNDNMFDGPHFQIQD